MEKTLKNFIYTAIPLKPLHGRQNNIHIDPKLNERMFRKFINQSRNSIRHNNLFGSIMH